MSWMTNPLFIVGATQVLFTASDLTARANMRQSPFAFATFFSWWFLFYFVIRQVAMFGQLYVFSSFQVGKTMALFGATSIFIANILGFLLLGEVLSWQAYLGVMATVFAFIMLAFSP